MVSEGRLIDDSDQGKFLCPVCRRLADSALPVVPGDSHNVWEQPTNFNILSMHSLGSLTASKEECGSLRLQYALSMLQTAASTVSRSEMLKALPMERNISISPNLEPVFQLLSGMYFPGTRDIFLRSGRVSPSVLMWATLKHSLVSTEIAARCEKSSLSARKGLSSLYDEYRSSCGFILPMLLKVIQSTRSTHLPDLLVRFRGLQLFSASICSGINSDKCPEGAISGEGNILWILKHANGEMVYPDMQFWDQASHPVLIHDPFSTLMYIKVPCPICETVQNEPALCLLCGRLCSPAWNSCCSGSECQAHSTSCGAGTGVFLLIRKTTILLQRNARKALWPSPYLDAYGEEDAQMRRGKPLYLNEERYAALTYMVASHGLDQSSEVLRQTTIGAYSLV